MGDAGGTMSIRGKFKGKVDEDEGSEEEIWDSDQEDETIARIQRAHFAQAAAMNPRKRSAVRPPRMSHKRKMEAVKSFHNFTKKLKKDTGITIRSLIGQNVLELSDFSSEDSESDSDGLSEKEFIVDPNAVQDLNDENESYIDPETGDFIEAKKTKLLEKQKLSPTNTNSDETLNETSAIEPKTLTISDIINEGDLDLSKNVEIAEVEESELCPGKTAEDLLNLTKQDSQDDFEPENLKSMDDIDIKQTKSEEEEDAEQSEEKKSETEDEVIVN